MQHSHQLTIKTDNNNKIDIKEYCLSRQPYVDVEGYRLYIINNTEVFHQEWLDMVNSLLPSPLLDTSFVFVREPKLEMKIHQDCFPPNRGFTYGLNYVLQSDPNSMQIYYGYADGRPHTTQYPEEMVGEIERVQVPSDRLLLIDTTTFHAIHVGNQNRWCVSLRTVDGEYDPDNPLSWEQIVDNYKHILAK